MAILSLIQIVGLESKVKEERDMLVTELNRDQLTELKCNYMTELVNEGTFAEVMQVDYNEPSYYDLANVNEIIPDNIVFEHYEYICFGMDDFFCTAGKEN